MKFFDNLLAKLNEVPNEMRSQNWSALYNEYELKIYDIRNELGI